MIEFENPEIDSFWLYKTDTICQVIAIYNHEVQRFQSYTQPVIIIYRDDDLCYYSIDAKRFNETMERIVLEEEEDYGTV